MTIQSAVSTASGVPSASAVTSGSTLTETSTTQTRLNQVFMVGPQDRYLSFTLINLALDDAANDFDSGGFKDGLDLRLRGNDA